MGKNILIIGHAFIINENRSVWSKLAACSDLNVDLLVPKHWRSNLVGDVQVKANKDSDIRQIYSFDTYFRGNGSLYFYKIWQTFKFFKNNHYDYILINQESWSLSLFFINLMRLLSFNLKSKTFLMIAQNIKKPKLRWVIPFEKFNLLFVDVLLGCCFETKDVFRWKGIDKTWKYFPLYYSDKIELNSMPEHGDDSPLRIGYIGRISSEKGIDSLIKAFDILKTKHNVELVVAGAGDAVEKIKSAGAIYLGVLAHDKVSSFYSQVDLLILPSLTRKFWKEQFGRVIVESVAAGRLILTSDSGAIPEVMGELELDLIFKENDVESIVDCFERYIKLGRDNKLQTVFDNAYSHNVNKFSPAAFVKRLMRYLDE